MKVEIESCKYLVRLAQYTPEAKELLNIALRDKADKATESNYYLLHKLDKILSILTDDTEWYLGIYSINTLLDKVKGNNTELIKVTEEEAEKRLKKIVYRKRGI